MVTGSPQIKHKLYYACLNFYPNGKEGGRKTKWIPTGLPERNSKRRAEQITEQLKALFERNGCLVGKYANAVNPIEKIAQEIPDFPEVTLDSLRELLGEESTDDHPDLERILELAESAPSANQEQPATLRKMPFCDYMVLWLERLAPKLDRGTYGSYRGYIHGRIYAYFHDLAVTVEELRPGHIEAFYRYLAVKCNLSQNSILHYHSNIRKALQQLYVKQTIPNNPADLISNRPDRTTYQASYYDEEQISTYLHIVKGTKMELPVLFASFYGFRRSEVLGIKDTVVNLRRHQLLVQHTVTIANIDHHTEVIKKDRTKSQHSLRSMPLVDTVETAILEANERQEHYRKKLGSFYCREDQHYLCRDECGQLLKPNYITAKHNALLESHGLPHIRFHDLRHRCATMLLAKHVPLDRIREWLGHSDIKMTMRYAHLDVSAAKDEMAAIMSDLLAVE